MKILISQRVAANVILILLSIVIIFHILVLLGIFPYSIVLGGRIQDKRHAYSLETIAILISCVQMILVSIHAGYLKFAIPSVILNIAFWAMVALFLINTFGNLLSGNRVEKIFFAQITMVLAFLYFILAINKKDKPIVQLKFDK
jgi:hypothetical protein